MCPNCLQTVQMCPKTVYGKSDLFSSLTNHNASVLPLGNITIVLPIPNIDVGITNSTET